jgi:membrane protease YdiL (CAAX protease family)
MAAVVALPAIALSGATDLVGSLVTHPIGSPIFFFTYAAASLAGYYALTRAFSQRDHGLTFGHPRSMWREMGTGAALGGTVMALAVALLAAIGVYRGEDFRLDAGLFAGIAMGVGAACGEEVFFRGVVFRIVNARFGSTCAVVGVSVLFGMLHTGNSGVGLLGGLSIVLTAGLMLNSAYLLHDRIWLSVGIHFAWNAVQAGVFGITVSGTETGRGLWLGILDGPAWLSGGSMGVEGSIATIALGTLGGVFLTVICVRRGRWRSFREARREASQIGGIGQAPTNG